MMNISVVGLLVDLAITFISICLFPVIFVSLYPARVSKKAINYIYWIEAFASFGITQWMLYDIPGYSHNNVNAAYMLFWYFVCRSWCKKITEKNPEDTPQDVKKALVITAIILVLEFVFYFILRVIINMLIGNQ